MIGLPSGVITHTLLVVLLLPLRATGHLDPKADASCPTCQSGTPRVAEDPLQQASMLQVSADRGARKKALHNELELVNEHSHENNREPPIVELTSSTPASHLNTTALELFEQLRQNTEKTYTQYGRIPTLIYPDSVSIDFEFETRAHVKLTPELLLSRGGIANYQTSNSVQGDEEGLVWPNVSKWFSVGMDGSGLTNANGEWRQTLTGVIELESVVMAPKEVIAGNFSRDVHSFLSRLRLHQQTDGDGFPMPFEGSKGIRISLGDSWLRTIRDPDKPCSFCSVQWTVGLPLQHTAKLLRMSGDSHWKEILTGADSLCSQKEKGCQPEYHALLSLAALVLRKLRGCRCGHPKRCMKTWLIRTHFGDLAMFVMAKLGQHELESLPMDVMKVGKLHGKDPVLPNGVMDYLRLPEMAELGGMVFPRNPSLHESGKQMEQDIPTDIDGLLRLSKRLMQNHSLVDKRLMNRGCHLHNSSSLRSSGFTVQDWLNGLLLGKDLMSDHDSDLSKSSFSHLVWKSMGSWRMKPGSGRVYLECRRTQNCLPGIMPQSGFFYRAQRADPDGGPKDA